MLAVIGVAWYFLFGYAFIPKIKLDEPEEVEAEQRLLDISGIDDAYDAILNKSTKEFIGYYPIDEGFLGWFTNRYGVDAIESIATYAALEQPDIWYQISGSSIHVLWYHYCKDIGFREHSFAKTFEKECQSDYNTSLVFTGDFSLAEGVGTTEYYNSVGKDMTRCLDEALLHELKEADILVVNNEFVYSTRGQALPGKDYHFRAAPDTISALLAMGTDVAGVANNHVYDFGPEGFLDTLETLEENGLPYTGAGRNLEQACEPVYFVANGRKIAIIAATQIERSTNFTKEATETEPGVLKTLDADLYASVIAQAERNADYVVCYVHWGTEGAHHYGRDQKALARTFVAAGADAVIGGHTHCLQGVDIIDGVPVFYSLGNFYFSQEAEMPQDYDTGIVRLVISSDGSLEARFLPCRFSQGRLTLLPAGEESRQVLNMMEEYSQGCCFDDSGCLIDKSEE